MRTLRHGPSSGWSISVRAGLALPLLLLLPAPAPISARQVEAARPEDRTQPAQCFTVDDMLELRSLSVADVTRDARWMAVTTSRRLTRLGTDYTRYGDPTYEGPGTVEVFVLDGRTGERRNLFDREVTARSFTWSPDGGQLAFLQRREETWRLMLWERERGRLREVRLRDPRPIASGSSLTWLPDGSGLILELRAPDWSRRAGEQFRALTEGPIIVHDAREPFILWDALGNTGALTVPARVDLARGAVTELIPEGNYGTLRLAEDGSFLTYVTNHPQKTTYTNQGRIHYELARLDLAGPSGERRVLIEPREERLPSVWNRRGDIFAWVEKGDVWVRSVDEAEGRNLTAVGGPYHDEPDTARVRFSVQRFSPDGNRLLCSSPKGWWLVDVASGGARRFFAFEEEEKTRPRRSVVGWSPDGHSLLASWSATDRWERGLVRINLESGEETVLIRDSDLYRNWRLSEDGSTLYYFASDGDHPEELWRADADLRARTRLTDTNPWLAQRKLTRSELVEYLDVDGEKLYGILYYPVDYEPGKRYPLVCEIYETFFDNGFNANMNLLANAGWFGFRPSVNLEIGYPGEAWVKGVTSGINKLIERGLVDGERLGVHGTSYGGYATALLVTQTDRFAAAINISGKVDMVSFYGDSPRLGVRNITAPENGQDRIGGSLWEYPERYLAHSAILFADRITTPLMLITGDLDPNVPARQSMEMYYAMRRLEKEVVWVRYAQGGHSPPNSVEETRDFWERILGWYRDHFEKVGKKK
jgi:dipeptidyl aminopeptidase/acylaminoacyl peptidase